MSDLVERLTRITTNEPRKLTAEEKLRLEAASELTRLRAALAEAERERDQARAFVVELFEETDWPEGGDLDGFVFQEAAARAGILTPQERTEFCAENCHCAEYHGDPTGGFVCYRKPQWLVDAQAARHAERAAIAAKGE